MAEPKHDWYASEWLKHCGKKQASLVNDLDWNKSRASLMVRGLQPYDRDSVNELSAYLDLEPFELLIPPDRAMSYRQLRASAETIAKIAPTGPVEKPASIIDESLKRGRNTRALPRKTGTGD